MDRLDALAIFVAIVDSGSLAGAARRMGRSPAGVTRALAALEHDVGARLIERSTRRLAPTEAGRALAERARDLLADYQEAVEGVAAAPLRGLLRVTAPVQFGRRHVAPVVTEFLDRYPELQVELVLNDRNLDLIEEGLDVAVRIGQLTDSALLVRRVGEVRRVLVACPEYLARRGTPGNAADLAHHDIIFNTIRSTTREWRLGPSGRTIVRLSPRFFANDVESLLLAAREGRGVGRFLSYQVADDLTGGSLVHLLPECDSSPLPVQLVTLAGPYMAPKVRAFLDHAAAMFRDVPALRPSAG